MKILFYSRGFAPIGGIETLYKNLSVFLQSRGHDCKIVYWGSPNTMLHSMEAANVKTVRSFWQWGSRWELPDWMMLPKGKKQVAEADVVIFGKGIPSNILKHIRKSASSHTKFVFITPYRPLVPTSAAEKQELLEMLRYFDLVVVQAASFEEDLREIGYEGRVHELPYLTQEPAFLQPLPDQVEIKIGFLGRLVEDKNIPLLLSSFQTMQQIALPGGLVKGVEKITLHLFGTGHLHQQLEERAAELGLGNVVHFHGAIANEKVMDAVNSCHFFAFSSLVEGQCLAALEILSCGRPIVATDAGAFPEILSDAQLGLLVPNADMDSFSKSLLALTNAVLNKTITAATVREAYNHRYAAATISLKYEALLAGLFQSENNKAAALPE